MNAGNRKKSWIKYLLSLPIVQQRDYGEIRTELREDKERNYSVVIRYENNEYDMSVGTDCFPKEELIEKYL